MTPSIGLPAVNFFMADVGGGLGAFLSTWLAQTEHWNTREIGFVLSAGLFTGMLLSTPAGQVIDRVGHPRVMLVATCLAVVTGTLALFVVSGFWPVLIAQMLVAAGGALGMPALTALTLAVIGKDGFPKWQGINQAATHAGNVFAAAAIWVLTFRIGASSSIAVLAFMAVGMLVALVLFPKGSVEHTRMAGRERRKKGEKRGSTRALLKNRRWWVLTGALGLFNFGNGAILPLLGQRMAADGSHDATAWLAILVIVAQAVMVPVAYLSGWSADRVGRRILLIGACIALAVRGVLAMWSDATAMLIALEVLDGIGAGILSVAGPAAIADLTYGGGRTQTAMGAVQTVQSLASAGAALASGYLVFYFGWPGAFGVFAVFPLLGVGLLMTITLRDEKPDDETPEGQRGENAAAISARV